MKILTFGKHKNEILQNTPQSYIKWLATHKRVLSVENRHFSDIAKEILENRMKIVVQEIALKEYEMRKEAEMAVKIAEQLVRANSIKHSNFSSHAFSILR